MAHLRAFLLLGEKSIATPMFLSPVILIFFSVLVWGTRTRCWLRERKQKERNLVVVAFGSCFRGEERISFPLHMETGWPLSSVFVGPSPFHTLHLGRPPLHLALFDSRYYLFCLLPAPCGPHLALRNKWGLVAIWTFRENSVFKTNAVLRMVIRLERSWFG